MQIQSNPPETIPFQHKVLPYYHSFCLKLPYKERDPFDSESIRLDAHVVSPSGKHIIFPCFYDKEIDEKFPWNFRFQPNEKGKHTCVFKITFPKQGPETILSVVFESTQQNTSDFQFFGIDDYSLIYPDGTRKKGVGINFPWEEEPGRKRGILDYEYETFLPRLKAMGCNIVRMWSCPWNLGFIWNTANARKQQNRYNSLQLRKIDRVFETAMNCQIHMIWCLDYHGALKEISDYWGGNAFWKEHPYHESNGGPCTISETLFTDPKARQLYKDRLRYILARWGYGPALGIVEFWNEIDNAVEGDTHSIQFQKVIDWHKEMAAYMNELDPFHRPLTTSLSHTFSKELYSIQDLNFAQLHLYQQSDTIISNLQNAKQLYQKPVIVGEIGYDWRAPEAEQVKLFKDDLQLAIWRTLFFQTPLLPMAWWWELYNENDGLPILQNASKFADIVSALTNWEVEVSELINDEKFEIRAIIHSRHLLIWVLLKDQISSPRTINVPLESMKSEHFNGLSSVDTWIQSRPTRGSHFTTANLRGKQLEIALSDNASQYIFHFCK